MTAADAAVALQKEAGNKQVSNIMGQVAIKDQDRKQSAMDKSLQSGTRHAALMAGYDTARANNIAKVASGLSDAAMSLDGSLDKLAGMGKDNVKGESTKASIGAEPDVVKPEPIDARNTYDYTESNRREEDNYWG